MLDDKFLEKLVAPRQVTANVLALESAGFDDGKTLWAVAPAGLRSIVQNLIDHVDDHFPLRSALMLLLVKSSGSQKAKLENGDRCVIGKASKANPQAKLMTRIGRGTKQPADFVIWINGDWLDGIGATDMNGTRCVFSGLCEASRQAVALIDHEMMHCSAKIAGEFINPDQLDGFVQDLGKCYIETCEEITDENGNVFVRYFAWNHSSGFDYKMRKHDIEEFNGIVDRHGAWDLKLKRLVDVIIESEPSLFTGV